MKAIETVYNGYKFRSRLEARWAVFFDALEVKYEYEKEGYDLEGTWYLPDFWLPEQKSWFEVKGGVIRHPGMWARPTEEDYTKAYLLCLHSQQNVYLAVGEIKIPEDDDPGIELENWTTLYSYTPEDIQELPGRIYPSCPLNAWVECTHCHRIEIVPNGYKRNLSCSCEEVIQKEQRKILDGYPEYMINSVIEAGKHTPAHNTPRLMEAYTAARQAQFEYGKKGTS